MGWILLLLEPLHPAPFKYNSIDPAVLLEGSLSRHPGDKGFHQCHGSYPFPNSTWKQNQASAQVKTGLLMRNDAEQIISLLMQSQRP